MLEELWASDYYYYKSLEYELRVYNADKADKEIERLRKALEWIKEWCEETPNGYLESEALLRLVQQALKEE